MIDTTEPPLFMAADLPTARPTLDLATLEVGSRVVVVPAYYGRGREPDVPGVVISRARVWCEIQADPDPDRTKPRAWRMRMDTQRDTDSNYATRFWTPEQWRFDQAHRAANDYLSAQGIHPEYSSAWSSQHMKIRLARLVWADLSASPVLEEAHRWVVGVIQGALGNGSGNDDLGDPELMVAILRILADHEYRGLSPAERKGRTRA